MRGRIKRLIREATSEGVLIRLRDGSVRAFDNMTVWQEMFLAQMDLFRGTARQSEVLEAVRNATPESREAFEQEYGPIEMEAVVICPVSRGGWVDVRRLTEAGEVEYVRHEGGSSEAERIRQEAVQRGPSA